MSTQLRASEQSVTFSLAELAKLEDERVRTEQAAGARARADRARERAAADTRRREAEAAELAAKEEARSRRLRAEAEEEARALARTQAQLDVARIEAAAKARLEADNATRAHELALAQVGVEARASRVRVALTAALGLTLAASTLGASVASSRLQRASDELGEQRGIATKLAEERDRARAAEQAAHEGRKGALAATELERRRLQGALQRRRADLTAWATEQKHKELLAPADAAAARWKARGDDESSRDLERVLDQLSDKLSERVSDKLTPGQLQGPGGGTQSKEQGAPCAYGEDPLCGIDGHRLL